MPELPEVETTIRELKPKVLKRTFIDVWSDSKKLVKKPSSFNLFKKRIKGRKIIDISRRGKNIIFSLSGGKILLVHLKMTGHILYGKWERKRGSWIPLIRKSFLTDPMNRFLHLVFYLDNNFMVALSDMRKFAKVELWDKDDFFKSDYFNKLGKEPLEKGFTFEVFKEIIPKKKRKIKQVLMDQSVIVGIGNIYSDEILWKAMVSPFKRADSLKEEELKRIFKATKEILKKAISSKGTSISDFRRPSGEKGNFAKKRKVYQHQGKKCQRCGQKIERKKIGGRSAHYCPNCQEN